jgi:hypothetical protein
MGNMFKLTLPIYKRGIRTVCCSYRVVSLLNPYYKIYAKILSNRTNKIAEHILMEKENAPRKGRSCTDCVFTVTQSIEKWIEFNLFIYRVSVDYIEAFAVANRTYYGGCLY